MGEFAYWDFSMIRDSVVEGGKYSFSVSNAIKTSTCCPKQSLYGFVSFSSVHEECRDRLDRFRERFVYVSQTGQEIQVLLGIKSWRYSKTMKRHYQITVPW